MEWVKDFYERQEQLSGVYSRQVDETDRERAATLANLSDPSLKRVLELGAGGGQTAAATADLGYEVTAIELVESAARHARALAGHLHNGTLNVIQGSFFEVNLTEQFDVISYWDGFGIGSDNDQQSLLKRIHVWLAPKGLALIDINTPWYWAKVAGRTADFGRSMRRYDFDAENCRMLDRWWAKESENEAVTQSLRCYSPADLKLLLQGTGLSLQRVIPGGAVDYERGEYIKNVPLGQAMQYLAILKRKTD